MKALKVFTEDAPKEVIQEDAPKSDEVMLSFPQFATQYRKDRLLMAALKTVALHEKHSLTEWIARLKAFGEQAA
jgi:hypothetical protein